MSSPPAPTPVLQPTDVGAPRPPDPAADAEILRDVDAIARGVLAAKRRRLWLGGAAVALLARYTAPLGPLSPASADAAVAARLDTLAQRVDAMARRGASRDSTLLLAITRTTLLLCDVMPRARTQQRRLPCAALQGGEGYPLGAAAPGLAPYVTVGLPAAGGAAVDSAFGEVARAHRQ